MIKVTDDKSQIIFSGVIKAAYRSKDRDKNGNIKEDSELKNVITVFPDDEKVFDQINAYEKSGDNYTPTWFKEREFVKLKSAFDIPVKAEDKEMTFVEFLERGLIKGGQVIVKFIQKDGSIYPLAILEKEPGEKFDAFEGMED